jgi:hypothetical protein
VIKGGQIRPRRRRAKTRPELGRLEIMARRSAAERCSPALLASVLDTTAMTDTSAAAARRERRTRKRVARAKHPFYTIHRTRRLCGEAGSRPVEGRPRGQRRATRERVAAAVASGEGITTNEA